MGTRQELDWIIVRKQCSREWRSLVLNHAPYASSSSSIWRYSGPLSSAAPDQGWKIHISGTPLNASNALRCIQPVLASMRVVYKIPVSLDELARINSGIFYGYSQIGKFVTVYPKNDEEFRSLAKRLHQATVEFKAPQIPFDFRFSDGSCVYFRYGRFRTGQLAAREDTVDSILTAPEGNEVPDDRYRANYVPGWDPPPIRPDSQREPTNRVNSQFNQRYCVFRSIVQRGKGGIYEALDMKRDGRRVIIKEGRAHGEVGWDGSDGLDLLRNEMAVLTDLRRSEVPVPTILDNFESGENSYLVLEKINGVTLQALIDRFAASLTDDEFLDLGRRIAGLVSCIHKAGWVWRDCKPSNLLVLPSGKIRPIDFEGASRVDCHLTKPWGSKGFVAPEALSGISRKGNVAEDLYALGMTLYFLFTGVLPEQTENRAGPTTQRCLPKTVHKTITNLLSVDPGRRPNAGVVVSQLS